MLVIANRIDTTFDLLQAWEEARAVESEANHRRLEIESRLCERLPAPEEGQKTHRVEDYRVVRTNKFYYRGDLHLLLPLSAELEIDLPIKQEPSESALRKLYKQDLTSFKIFESEGAVKRTAAKPQFEVSRVSTA